MKRYIADGLTQYVSEEKHPWHMPGHKRKALWQQGSAVQEMLADVMQFDVTEVPGTDDLYQADGFIADSMKQLGEIYGTVASYYLVNGSTAGVLTAVASCCAHGDGILVARNCHKSVYNAVQMLGLTPVYIQPEYLSEDSDIPEINGPITVEQIELVLSEYEDVSKIRAMVLTSPTYEGVVSDIEAIAKCLHVHDIALIVDEAHGAHLPFVKELPESAISCGADIVVQSLHKTLSAMTQTAILHVCDEKYISNVEKWMQVFMSSSPSYIFLCSMEEAILRAYEGNHTMYMNDLRAFRERLEGLKHITILKHRTIDETRLVLWAKTKDGKMISGTKFLQLLEKCGIVGEMAGMDYIVLISTIEDSKGDFEFLFGGLSKVDEAIDMDDLSMIVPTNTGAYEDAFLYSLVGKKAVDNIYVYPPGSYLLTAGELYTEEIVSQLVAYQQSGKTIRGNLT